MGKFLWNQKYPVGKILTTQSQLGFLSLLITLLFPLCLLRTSIPPPHLLRLHLRPSFSPNQHCSLSHAIVMILKGSIFIKAEHI